MLGEPLLIIGRQVALDGGKDRIDLLALDQDGSFVVIELKRDLIGGSADLLALRVVIAALAERGVASKAYLPCIHLMPPYRERFGFQEGQFRVAERIAERSLALPFFTAMGEQEVERVTEALAAAIGQPVG
jgi:DegT/DnrJ/EryC1/StrS aminotransferase family